MAPSGEDSVIQSHSSEGAYVHPTRPCGVPTFLGTTETLAWRGLPADELHIASGAVRLQRGQPLQESLVLLPGRDRWRRRLDAGLVQGPSLHLEVGPGVDLGALEVGMPQDVPDHHQ